FFLDIGRDLVFVLADRFHKRFMLFFFFYQSKSFFLIFSQKLLLFRLLDLQLLIENRQLIGFSLDLLTLIPAIIRVLFHVLRALVRLQEIFGRQQKHGPALCRSAFIGFYDHLGIILL